jgi:hypothetical protein
MPLGVNIIETSFRISKDQTRRANSTVGIRRDEANIAGSLHNIKIEKQHNFEHAG